MFATLETITHSIFLPLYSWHSVAFRASRRRAYYPREDIPCRKPGDQVPGPLVLGPLFAIQLLLQWILQPDPSSG